MSVIDASDRFAALPDEKTLAATVVALEEHGFSVEVVDDLHLRLENFRPRSKCGQGISPTRIA